MFVLTVLLRILSLRYSDCPSEYDTMSVYDGDGSSSPLVGIYCGTEVPQYFRSSGESLYVVFKSDVSLNFRGFEAAYYRVPDACDVHTVVLEPELNIVGGKPAQEGEWPWQVALYYYKTFICSGDLLTPEWVVTLASCAADDNHDVYDVIVGSNNINGASEHAQIFTVSEVIAHPQFDFSKARYDISLLRLRTNATITDYVRTVCLPTMEMDSDFPAGTTCTATGWGDTFVGGPGTDELFEVDVPIVDQVYCRALYAPTPITDEMLCAGVLDGSRGVCYGDSGGPLVSQLDDTWYIIGIPSWSRGCADSDYPAVYTRISYFEEWIADVIDGNHTVLDCNKNFTEAPGIFTSPFYPENYPNNVDGNTLITAPEGFNIYLSIRYFRLEDHGTIDCLADYDTLSVFDSHRMDSERLIGVFCGGNIARYLISTGRSMYVFFKSDSLVTEKGFDVAFYFLSNTGCDIVLTQAPGTFTSPEYPDNYPNDARCTTLITAPTRQRVSLIVQDFKLEYDKLGCGSNYDTLSVYDGNSTDDVLIGVYCSDSIPDMISSTSESIFIDFQSNDRITSRGFEIAYYFLPEMQPSTSASPQPGCGQQTVSLEPESLVVGGSPAQQGEWPWQSGILWNNIFICGGVSLTPQWVVTTAQCVQQEVSGYVVLLGTNNLAGVTDNAQRRELSAIYIHPEYDEEIHDFNIALLKLSSPVTITDYVRTACAPTIDMASYFDIDTDCFATGWGASSMEGSIKEELHEVSLSIVKNDDCVTEALPDLSNNMMCAGGSDGSGVCIGDDRGPLISKVDDRWYLVGLTVRPEQCAGRPSVFTRMTEFYDWISPIFEGKNPSTSPTEDPLEPIRKELEKAKEDSELYMDLTYTFIGVIGLIVLTLLYTLWYNTRKRSHLENQLAATAMNAGDEPAFTNEGYYSDTKAGD